MVAGEEVAEGARVEEAAVHVAAHLAILAHLAVGFRGVALAVAPRAVQATTQVLRRLTQGLQAVQVQAIRQLILRATTIHRRIAPVMLDRNPMDRNSDRVGSVRIRTSATTTMVVTEQTLTAQAALTLHS